MNKFKKSLSVILSILIALIIILITGISSPKKDNIEEVYNVYLDGKLIGAVNSKDSLEKYIDNDQKELKDEFNVDKVYIPNGIDIVKCVTHNTKISTEKEIYNKIKEKKSFTIKGYIVSIKSNDEKEIKINKYTNLGLLLSDQCPYSIKCAIFSGLNKIEFRDRKEFTGSILKQVDDIFKYFEIFNKTSGKIIGLKRIDTRDYPEFSLREALLNAVIHRSYYYNSSVMVKIYDDRFEITSMGGLIDGITIADIFKGISLSRNPNLSNIFYRFGYVESFGTGIGRIMDSYNEFDKKPLFDATENTFSIILPNMNYKEVIDNYVNDNNIIFHSLSQEDMIVQFLKKYNKINRNETEKLLNVSNKSPLFLSLFSIFFVNLGVLYVPNLSGYFLHTYPPALNASPLQHLDILPLIIVIPFDAK